LTINTFKMTLEQFIVRFREEFEYLEEDEILEPSTLFQEIDGWDSLTAIMILEMIDDEFEADISGDELRACSSIEELFNLAVKRSS